MVAVTVNGVTFEPEEPVRAVEALYRMCDIAVRSMDNPRNITSGEEYIEALCSHYNALFPLSSVMVCASAHTISGPCYHQRFEQPLNIFKVTRRVDVYVIGRGQGTVFTLLGDGGFANWRFSGWLKRDGSRTVRFY